jgi:hypothetical protein
MSRRINVLLIALCMLAVVLLVGCNDEKANLPAPAHKPVASITLPDGTKCQNIGVTAAISVANKATSYNCGKSGADALMLLDNFKVRADALTLEKGVVSKSGDEYILKSSAPVDMLITQVSLEDGTRCFNASQGAVINVDNKRATFTCGQAGPDSVVLLGDFQVRGVVMIARKAIASPDGSGAYKLKSAESLPVLTITGTALP